MRVSHRPVLCRVEGTGDHRYLALTRKLQETSTEHKSTVRLEVGKVLQASAKPPASHTTKVGQKKACLSFLSTQASLDGCLQSSLGKKSSN